MVKYHFCGLKSAAYTETRLAHEDADGSESESVHMGFPLTAQSSHLFSSAFASSVCNPLSILLHAFTRIALDSEMKFADVRRTMYPVADDMNEKLVPVYKDPVVQVTVQPSFSQRADGLRLPTSRSFGIMVGIYKVILSLSTVLLCLSVAGLAYVCILINYGETLDDHGQTSDGYPTMAVLAQDDTAAIRQIKELLPFVVSILMFYVVDVTIGWIAAVTLRMRYLKIDLCLQIFVLLMGIMGAVMSPVLTIRSVLAIMCQVGEVCLIHGIIDAIRKVNAV